MFEEHTREAEDLTAMLRVWPDVEREVIDAAVEEADPELADAVGMAFRVEANTSPGGIPRYTLFYDVERPDARAAAAVIDNDVSLRLIAARLLPGVFDLMVRVRMVSERKPIEGEVCPRVMTTPAATPSLEELPNPEPEGSTVPLIERDRYWLTPIEEPFYDALRATELTFAVQPWIQQGDRRYRVDFIVFWSGRAVVVELDGHEGHSSKEQRRHDYERERWLQAHGLKVVRWTGSDVYADAQGCVKQLLVMLRGQQARA